MENVIQISSWEDRRIAGYRNLKDSQLRERQSRFIIEGKLVLERFVIESPMTCESVLVLEKHVETVKKLKMVSGKSFDIFQASQEVMDAIVGFNFHRGFLALGKRSEELELSKIVSSSSLLVLLERVLNPENIGSVFRNAAALGADAVILSADCADPLYRLATRVSIGTTTTLPWIRVSDFASTLMTLRSFGVRLFAMSPSCDSQSLSCSDTTHRPAAIVLGSEGDGLTAASIDACDATLRIDMANEVDSLNVATAAAVGLFHFRR